MNTIAEIAKAKLRKVSDAALKQALRQAVLANKMHAALWIRIRNDKPGHGMPRGGAIGAERMDRSAAIAAAKKLARESEQQFAYACCWGDGHWTVASSTSRCWMAVARWYPCLIGSGPGRMDGWR